MVIKIYRVTTTRVTRVRATFDAEASEIMDEDDVVESFCEDFRLLLDSDQIISLAIFYDFIGKAFKLDSTRVAELAEIGCADNLQEFEVKVS